MVVFKSRSSSSESLLQVNTPNNVPPSPQWASPVKTQKKLVSFGSFVPSPPKVHRGTVTSVLKKSSFPKMQPELATVAQKVSGRPEKEDQQHSQKDKVKPVWTKTYHKLKASSPAAEDNVSNKAQPEPRAGISSSGLKRSSFHALSLSSVPGEKQRSAQPNISTSGAISVPTTPSSQSKTTYYGSSSRSPLSKSSAYSPKSKNNLSFLFSICDPSFQGYWFTEPKLWKTSIFRARFNDGAIALQKISRGWLARKSFQRYLSEFRAATEMAVHASAAIQIQCAFRVYHAKLVRQVAVLQRKLRQIEADKQSQIQEIRQTLHDKLASQRGSVALKDKKVEKRLSQLQREINLWKTENKKMRADNEVFQRAIKAIKEENKKLEKSLLARVRLVANLEAQNAQLEIEIPKWEKINEDFEERSREFNDEVAYLEELIIVEKRCKKIFVQNLKEISKCVEKAETSDPAMKEFVFETTNDALHRAKVSA